MQVVEFKTQVKLSASTAACASTNAGSKQDNSDAYQPAGFDFDLAGKAFIAISNCTAIELGMLLGGSFNLGSSLVDNLVGFTGNSTTDNSVVVQA